MAANREVVQRRTFAKGFTRNFSVFLAFYRSTIQKRKPKFSTVRSTVGQDFDAKLCNSALRNSLGLNYKSAALPGAMPAKMRRTLTHTAAWNKLPRLQA